MKIVILSLGIYTCPSCKERKHFFVDYYRDEKGTKLPYGVVCGKCDTNFSDEEFEQIQTSLLNVTKEES